VTARDKQESFGIPPGGEIMVHEVRSKSVLLLLTTLRDRRSPPSMFRRTAGRLIMLVSFVC
jgi:uracil phosphoribosyltransferase